MTRRIPPQIQTRRPKKDVIPELASIAQVAAFADAAFLDHQTWIISMSQSEGTLWSKKHLRQIHHYSARANHIAQAVLRLALENETTIIAGAKLILENHLDAHQCSLDCGCMWYDLEEMVDKFLLCTIVWGQAHS